MAVASSNESFYPVMGCYGIGVSRRLAAIIEQNHDEKGIIWPKSVAPYEVCVLQISDNSDVTKFSEDLYHELLGDYSVVYDDRDISPGIKFSDSDIVGVPVKLISSPRNVKKDVVEVENRKTGESIELGRDSFMARFERYYHTEIK